MLGLGTLSTTNQVWIIRFNGIPFILVINKIDIYKKSFQTICRHQKTMEFQKLKFLPKLAKTNALQQEDNVSYTTIGKLSQPYHIYHKFPVTADNIMMFH